MTTNHEEALQLAQMKRDGSNLARCYIDLEARVKALEDALSAIRDYIQRWSGNALGESGTKLAITVDDIARAALAPETNSQPD